jgi:hypothetical protein
MHNCITVLSKMPNRHNEGNDAVVVMVAAAVVAAAAAAVGALWYEKLPLLLSACQQALYDLMEHKSRHCSVERACLTVSFQVRSSSWESPEQGRGAASRRF